MRRPSFVYAASVLWLCASSGLAQAPKALSSNPGQTPRGPQAGWDFAFKQFVIGAWWSPTATDAEYAVFRKAGFNVVMSHRCRLPDKALELARKHDLKVMVDTYTPNDKPWGGKAGEFVPQPTIHSATLPELKWLHARYGRHPALAGYLLGDDFWTLPPPLVRTTRFLHQRAPHLFPWICQNKIDARSLASAGNPIGCHQVYPTLYMKPFSGAVQSHLLSQSLELCRRLYRQYGLIMWPMLNVSGVQSDSLVDFSVNASLAYGAQGLWHYKYGGGSLQRGGGYKTVEEVERALTPTWHLVRAANRRVTRWAPRLLGRRSVGVLHTGEPAVVGPRPAGGMLVERMSKCLLVGVLAKPGAPPLALVVDRRVGTQPEPIAAREVVVQFAPAVARIEVLAEAGTRALAGHKATLRLRGGGARLLRLGGHGLDTLCDDLDRAPVAQRAAGPDGLVLHLSFDETTGQVARDSSPMANHAWLEGTRWIGGKVGGAVSFGDRPAIGVVWNACLPATDAMSIAMWVRLNYPTRGFGPALSVGSLWSRSDLAEIVFGQDNLYPKITNQQNDSVHDLYVNGMKKQIPPGVWGHVAVCAGPGGATVYVNGRRATHTDYAARFDFVVGNVQIGRRGGGEQYQGDLDELKIWNRCLSADEVRALIGR